MDSNIITKKKGRPKKDLKMDVLLHLKCSSIQAEEIRRKATLYHLPISVYLRECALKNKVQIRSLPTEVLAFQTRNNQICALLNQLAFKKNRNEQLTAIERAEISSVVEELHQMVQTIRKIIYDN
jgi:hypothetical protein